MKGHWDNRHGIYRAAVPGRGRWVVVLCVGLALAIAASLCHAQELGEVERMKERIARESAVLPTDIPIDMSAQRVTFSRETQYLYR